MAAGDVVAIIKNKQQNLLINGAFEFDQEKEGGSYTSSGNYCLDQWVMAGATSCIRASVTSNPYGYVLRSTATAANNRYNQRIERARIKELVGKTLTLSVYAQVISGSWSANPIKARVEYANAPDNFAGTTNVFDVDMTAVSGSNIPDGTKRRFYHKFVVTQNMVDNGFLIGFGDFTNATNVVEYSMVMLNEGVLSPFSRNGNDYNDEEAICHRYYFKTYPRGIAVSTAGALNNYQEIFYSTSTIYRRQVSLPVVMRANPVTVFYSPSAGTADRIDFNGTPFTSTITSGYPDRVFAGASGLTALGPGGNGYDTRFHFVANARL